MSTSVLAAVARESGINDLGILEAAIQVARALLVREAVNEYLANAQKISDPQNAADILRPYLVKQEQEVMVVLLLDTKNHPLHVIHLYKGTLNAAQVRVAEIFREAIRINAAGVILAHNHHSGDPTPSPEDIAITRQIVEAGNLLEIPVLDHLVFGQDDKWVSIHKYSPSSFKEVKP